MNSFEWFFCGLVIGYFWYPLWELGKKIVSEAQQARAEWRKNPPKQKDLF
jgi:hypothetical protein